MNQFRDFFKDLFLLPAFGGGATVFGVLAGYLGSHYDKRISDAVFPFFWPGATFEGAPTVFWCVTFLFGACFCGTLWAQKISDAATNGEFKESLRALFTMPSRGFLQRYQAITLTNTNFIWTLPASLPLPQLEQAIRVQLSTICNVVKEYDSAGSVATYGCNVMRYLGASDARFLANQAALQLHVRCIETGVAISNLAGVLDLQLPLSISSTTSINPDSRLTPLALPIPNAPLASLPGRFSNVVPGAPYAFVSQTSLIFGRQRDLIDEVEKNRAFSSTVLADLTSILSVQATQVQALICIPIYATQQGGPAASPIGVLNIHRSLADEHAAAKFENLLPLLTTMVQNLGQLVEQLP